jgi:hypothetical protein
MLDVDVVVLAPWPATLPVKESQEREATGDAVLADA